ncbi:MAG: FAD:protein FMN transferase [Clostridiales bacterium]|nr:FAD:protein FMN transferase [Clostridiales bacterium]
MAKKSCFILLVITLLLASTFPFGVAQESSYTDYSDGFFGTFDTWITILGYTTSPHIFQHAFDQGKSRFEHLHMLYDKYSSYEGITNIYTLNQQAGISPVVVEKDLLDLLLFSKEMQTSYPNTVNIAMGTVLEIWHDHRTVAQHSPTDASLPSLSLLQEANNHTDIEDVVIDIENNTVFFSDPKLQLDVGAVAKGFATQIVADEMASYGMPSFSISAGGNVATGAPPMDGRSFWSIGIQDPSGHVLDPNAIIDSVYVSHSSVVTSGNYERFFSYEGENYHHIIDPKTLFPANHLKQITIVCPDSGEADFLSTVLFLLPIEEGLALIDQMPGYEACWVSLDDTITTSSGWALIARSGGVSNPAQ